jgi:opacity protein-like surface antigen
MKKLMLLALMFTATVTSAQDKLLSFGLKGGVNFANLRGDVETIDFNTRSSYHFGATLEISLLENLSIQPEVLYSVQGSNVDSALGNVDDVEFKYITVPIMAKFYVTENLSLDVGPQFAFMTDNNLEDTLETESFDFSVGAGITYNIGSHLFLQGRYMAGLTDASKEAEIKNSVFQISAGFKF